MFVINICEGITSFVKSLISLKLFVPISKIAKFYGSEVIKRPKKLSGDKIGLEPTISHVLDSLNEKEKYVPDLIIILQNTSPLRNSRHIDEALKLLIKNKFDLIYLFMNIKNESN